jgi:hypothetical protein
MHFDIEAARASIEKLVRPDPAALRRDIETFARPRLTGGEGAQEIEARVRRAFDELGYEARELPFTFSTLPGRFGISVAGALLLLTGWLGAWSIAADLPAAALVILFTGLALSLAPLYLLGPGLRRLPWWRIETANLLFARPGARPSWIVMAHRDSKSQLVPTLVRTAMVFLGVAGWLALVLLAGLWYAGDLFRFSTLPWVAGALTALAGLVLALSWAGDRSPGALDNATGLAALLAVARGDGNGDVAFLVTDGEELGLAGARAVVDDLPAVQGVINLDGLDDRGEMIVAEGHGLRRRGSAPQLAAGLLTAGRALGLDIRRRPLPRTIPVDHVPLAAAGVPAVTVLRGDWGSLGRVHRPSDRADRLTGRGAAETAATVAAALHLLRESRPSHLAGGGAVAS